MLVIPKNQCVKEGELFEILLYGLSVFLKASEMTMSASYDTTCRPIEFDPNFHGFKGMNEALCTLILMIEMKNPHCIPYLIGKDIISA